MSDACKICKALNRPDIEKAMEVPRSDSAVSRRFKLSRATITKHRAHIVHHDAIDLPNELDTTEISRLKAEATRILNTAKDDKVRLAALQRLESLYGLELRIQQESKGTTTLENDAAFQQIVSQVARSICAECMGKLTVDLRSLLGTSLSHAKRDEGTGGVPALEK